MVDIEELKKAITIGKNYFDSLFPYVVQLQTTNNAYMLQRCGDLKSATEFKDEFIREFVDTFGE